MTSSIIQIGRTRLGVDRKQLINSRHNARRDTILRAEFQRLYKLSARVRPTAGMHDVGSAHLFISGVAIALQDAFKLSRNRFGPSRPRPSRKSNTTLPLGLPYDERWPSESDSPGNEAVAHGPGHSRRIRQAGPVHSLLPGSPAHGVTILAAPVRRDESHGPPGA